MFNFLFLLCLLFSSCQAQLSVDWSHSLNYKQEKKCYDRYTQIIKASFIRDGLDKRGLLTSYDQEKARIENGRFASWMSNAWSELKQSVESGDAKFIRLIDSNKKVKAFFVVRHNYPKVFRHLTAYVFSEYDYRVAFKDQNIYAWFVSLMVEYGKHNARDLSYCISAPSIRAIIHTDSKLLLKLFSMHWDVIHWCPEGWSNEKAIQHVAFEYSYGTGQ